MSDKEKKNEAQHETVTIKMSDLQEVLGTAMQKGIENGIAMAALANQQHTQQAKAAAAPKTVIVKDEHGKERAGIPGEQCTLCKQQLLGCMGEHRFMAVYPRNRRHGKYFQGVLINGVRYLSNSLAHKIWVPANASIEYLIQQFEINEEETMNGRTFEHDSGAIGGSTSFNPATGAWR